MNADKARGGSHPKFKRNFYNATKIIAILPIIGGIPVGCVRVVSGIKEFIVPHEINNKVKDHLLFGRIVRGVGECLCLGIFFVIADCIITNVRLAALKKQPNQTTTNVLEISKNLTPEISIGHEQSPIKAEEPIKTEESIKTEEPIKTEESIKTEEPIKAEEYIDILEKNKKSIDSLEGVNIESMECIHAELNTKEEILKKLLEIKNEYIACRKDSEFLNVIINLLQSQHIQPSPRDFIEQKRAGYVTLNNRPIIIHFERYNGSYEEYFNEFVIGNSKFYIYAFELAKYNQLFDIFPRRLDSDCLDLCFMDLQTWIEETILMNPTIENIVKTAWSRTIERMNNRNREKFMEKPDASRNFIQKILDVKKFYWENESKRPLTYSILDTYIKTVGLF